MSQGKLMLRAPLIMLPVGITSAIFIASAPEIAATLGLSADESSWFNICYLLGQLVILPLASWVCYRIGARRLLQIGIAVGLCSSLVSGLTQLSGLHCIAWLGHGVAANCMLLAIQVMVLRHLQLKDIATTEGGMLLMTTLLPMGIYPWFLAKAAEAGMWQLVFGVLSVIYALLLSWCRLSPLALEDEHEVIRFNPLQAIFMTAGITGLVLVLMRGQFYNWFDSPLIINISLLTASLLLLCIFAIKKSWGSGEYLRSDVLSCHHNKVAMYNAAIAGFAVLGTATLIGAYMASVLQYSRVVAAWIQLPTFGAMLLGLCISVWISQHPKIRADIVVPVGVLMILLATAFLSNSNEHSGAVDLLPALLLRSLGVGLLNVTVSISILSAFKRHHIPQGVSYFYLMRTLGGIVGAALFSRLMSQEASGALNVLGANFNPNNIAFIHQQQAMTTLLENNLLEATPARVAKLMSLELQQQTAAIAGVNNFQWFIISVLILVPFLIAAKKWLSRRPAL
jgi:MFS transporter, DHA2 family, multidrug resistance protein